MTAPVVTFANGVDGGGRPGHRCRRHPVDRARAAVQRPAARSSPASTPTARWSTPTTPTGWSVDDNLRMYLGRGTKVYVLPLRHRNDDVLRRHRAAVRTATWSPEPSMDHLMAMVEGFDERIVNIARDLDLATGERPRRLRHRSRRHLALRVGRAARRRRPLDVPPPGPGRELGDPRRRWSRRRPAVRPDSVKEALALYQADPQAGHRRASAHLASGLERGRGQRRSSPARSPVAGTARPSRMDADPCRFIP